MKQFLTRNTTFSFFKPKKDLCAICSLYEQAEDTRKACLEENYRAHLERKNRVREIKREEKAAVDSTCTTVAVFRFRKSSQCASI